MEPRKYVLELVYNGVNATKEITPYLSSANYTDAIDESDTISITLMDRDGKWVSDWVPQKEDRLSPSIGLYDWESPGSAAMVSCGEFMVDDYSFSGPPDTITMNGISAPLNLDFKETKRSKTWKEVTLSQIGAEVAGKYGLELLFDGSDIPILKTEQSQQTDAEFLKRTAEKYGFGLKLYSGKIVLFEYAKYEAADAKITIKKEEIRKWSYKSTMLGTYTGAKVSYTNPKSKEVVEIMVGKEGRLYNTTEKADSPADAERIALNALRNANRKETTVSFTIHPRMDIHASDITKIEGLGNLDGRYQVGKVIHQINRKDYSMQITGWRVAENNGETEGAGENQQAGDIYEVKSGDTLWELAKQFYGDAAKYLVLYDSNREVIEQAAKKRGKSSSSSGYWIFPGTQLTVPKE